MLHFDWVMPALRDHSLVTHVEGIKAGVVLIHQVDFGGC